MSNSLSMDLRVRFRCLMDDGVRAAVAGCTLLLSPVMAACWSKKDRDDAPLIPRPTSDASGRERSISSS